MYEIILFDLDDTLFDFSDSENKSLHSIHQMYYSSAAFKEFETNFKAINGSLWKRVGARENALKPGDVRLIRFEQLNKALGCEVLATTIAETYEKYLGEFADWISGARSAIEFLHQKGHIMGVVTNGLVSVQDRKYHRHQLGKWFDCFIVSDRVGVAKPDREIFDHAFDEISTKRGLNLSALRTKTMLMVGDSIISDGQSAANLGMDFCFINQKAIETAQSGLMIKYDIKSVEQLPGCLGYNEEYESFLASRRDAVSCLSSAKGHIFF